MINLKDRLLIYKDKSILEKDMFEPQVFAEGVTNSAAQKRAKMITEKLQNGFLQNVIDNEKNNTSQGIALSSAQRRTINNLVNSLTSEVGRALIGLTVLQLSIKTICPAQSIRLHKGGGRGDFSWVEGISMRTLDTRFITPTLRQYDLLKLNKDGFMMTRSLAENYPYGTLYKAAMRGAKDDWVTIVETLEEGTLPPLDALRYLLSLLINSSEKFKTFTTECINTVSCFANTCRSTTIIFQLLQDFIESSVYSARAFEVVLHAAFQVFDEMGKTSPHRLKPLSQMRSANKKHGNIGDIELLALGMGTTIIESWDAKYDKPNLREELEELFEKLNLHQECRNAGFITNQAPVLNSEIITRIHEIEGYYECKISIVSFDEWHKNSLKWFSNGKETLTFSRKWLIATAESFGQMRREIAPIDEPCLVWLESLLAQVNARAPK